MNEVNKFYRTWYAPNNAVMVISGKFDKAEVLKKIDQILARLLHVRFLPVYKCQNWIQVKSIHATLRFKRAVILLSFIFI
jgi:predicted Zn-dependent peptidase